MKKQFEKARESNLCGYMAGITICDGEMIWEQNPLPDGDQMLPRHLSFGPPENFIDPAYSWTPVIVGSLVGMVFILVFMGFIWRYHQLGMKVHDQFLQKSDAMIALTIAEAKKVDGKYVGCAPDCRKHHKSKPVCLVSTF